jgi:type I restriction enzyme S subunit
MSPLYTVFRTHDVDHGYLEYYFKTTSWHKFMKLNGDSGARFDRFSISSSLFMEMPIPYPSMEEQVKIGAYFSTLDHLITLHQRKCEETKMLKKYMLKKMFPNDGECIPEIRFSGFTDAWEQRKLGEVITTGTVLRVFKEQWQGEGIPFFRSIDVVSEYKGVANPKDKAFISKEVYDDLTSRCGKIKKGDVLVTGGGSIGTPYLVKSNDPLYFKDGDLLWLIPEEKITGEYLYRFFTTPLFIKYVNSITHKGTIAHYTIEQVKATPIKLPTVEEQTKLAEYFATLDHLITLHQRKYEELQNIKKFMLQNMFV